LLLVGFHSIQMNDMEQNASNHLPVHCCVVFDAMTMSVEVTSEIMRLFAYVVVAAVDDDDDDDGNIDDHMKKLTTT